MICLIFAGRAPSAKTEAEAYADAVVAADFEEPGDADVIRKVVGDLRAAGVSAGEDEVRRVLNDLLVVATGEINAGR